MIGKYYRLASSLTPAEVDKIDAALASDLPSLRVFMATLRKKIEPDPASPVYLQTHVGIGYRMLRVE